MTFFNSLLILMRLSSFILTRGCWCQLFVMLPNLAANVLLCSTFGGLWLALLSSSRVDICQNWLKTFIFVGQIFKEGKKIQLFGVPGIWTIIFDLKFLPNLSLEQQFGEKHSKCIFSGCLLFWVSVCSYLWLCSRQKSQFTVLSANRPFLSSHGLGWFSGILQLRLATSGQGYTRLQVIDILIL